MIPRFLSIAAPLFVYFSLGLLAFGLFRERKSIEWVGGVAAAIALTASFALVTPVHQLFFDEDIYIHIASNLSHAPVGQITLLGGPQESEVSSYYKTPVGFPVLLSLVFLFTGTSEAVAFTIARIIFSLLVAGVYQLARRMGLERSQALAAAIVFASVPVCFRFSVSAGTDLLAALWAVLGMCGIAAGNGPLAVAGMALAAQTRLELIALVPLLFLSRAIEKQWKFAGLGLILAELLHVEWVLSAAPAFAAFERVPSAFAFATVLPNFKTNVAYFLDPLRFPVLVPLLSIVTLVRREKLHLALWTVVLFGVYLFFYAGSFDLTPRYSIQIIAPMAVLAVSAIKHRYAIPALLLSAALAFWHWPNGPEYVPALILDHAIATEVASTLGQDELVISTEPEVFLNHGVHAMSSFYAATLQELPLERLRRYRRVLYYAGAQTNVVNTAEWRADEWIKSHYKLRLIDSHKIGEIWIAYFDLSAKADDRVGDIGTSSGPERDGR